MNRTKSKTKWQSAWSAEARKCMAAMRETQALLKETQARTARLVEAIDRHVTAREAGAR